MTKNPDQAGAAIEVDATSPVPESSDSLRWSFINRWKVEPQSNDRAPVGDVVVPSSAAPAAVRSMTRRKQQARFKEWSRARHD